MFVVDFLAASLLAVVLTIAFACIVRHYGVKRFGDFSAKVWLMAISSWAGGILLLAFAPPLTSAHWMAFAVAGVLALLLVPLFAGSRTVNHSLAAATGQPGNDARPAIAVYFVLTLLLFFCAVSVRFYIVHLA